MVEKMCMKGREKIAMNLTSVPRFYLSRLRGDKKAARTAGIPAKDVRRIIGRTEDNSRWQCSVNGYYYEV